MDIEEEDPNDSPVCNEREKTDKNTLPSSGSEFMLDMLWTFPIDFFNFFSERQKFNGCY